MAAARIPVLTSRHLAPRHLAAGLLALGVVVAAGGALTLYLRREAIAVQLAFDYLRDHGVPADVRIDRLDLGGASGSVRLGPKGRPDLTVDRVEARFGAFPSPWAGLRAPSVSAVTLVRPTLHARWRNGRLDFGSLQPLVDQALHALPNGRAPVDLYVQGGLLDLDTSAGRLVVALDAVVEGGRVRSLHLRLEPADLDFAGVRVARVQGVVSGAATGVGALHLTGAFGAAQAQAHGAAGATGLVASVEALTPNAIADASTRQAPLDATVRLKAVRLGLRTARGEPLELRGADAQVDLSGRLAGPTGFAGEARLAARVGRVGGRAASLDAVVLKLQSDPVQVRKGSRTGSAGAPFTLTLSADGGRWRAAGVDGTFAPLRLRAAGRFASTPGVSLQAKGDLRGGVGLERGTAARLARNLAGKVDPAVTAALGRALQRTELSVPAYAVAFDGRSGLDLRLPGGARVALAGGGALEVRPEGLAPLFHASPRGERSGAAILQVQAPGLPVVSARAPAWRVARDGAFHASLDLAVRGDFGPVRQGSVRFNGGLDGDGHGWSARASQCAPLRIDVLRLGGANADAVALQACPQAGSPLLSYAAHGWRLRSRLEDAAFTLAAKTPQGGTVRVRLDAAETDLAGGRGEPSGRMTLQDLTVEDAAAAPRWRPVRADGPLTLDSGEIHGRLALAAVRPATSLGALELRAQPAAGTGKLAFTGAPLRFASAGLQPGDLIPAAGAILPHAEGNLQLFARVAWTRTRSAASAEARSDGLSFRSPAGRLDGLRGEVRFASLFPLATRPGQSLAADRLETLLPLDDLRVRFTLEPGRLDLSAASADVAGGRASLDPFQVPLTADSAAATPIAGALRLEGVDAERVISVLNLADAVSITARLDGALPFVLQPDGAGGRLLRIAGGRVAAEGPGRLSLSRHALAGVMAGGGAAPGQSNAVQDFGYQALEDLAFTQLDAAVDSRPGGRMGAVVHVAGVHDPAVDVPTRVGLWALLRGHAFDRPLPLPKGTPVELTLDTSLNLDDVLGALGRAGRQGSAPVQP